MNLKPDTMVQLNITAASALKLYAVVGKMNGSVKSNGTFDELKRVLCDSKREFYDKHIYHRRKRDILDYSSYESELSDAFFNRKTKEQEELEKVEEQIRELDEKRNELYRKAVAIRQVIEKQ